VQHRRRARSTGRSKGRKARGIETSAQEEKVNKILVTGLALQNQLYASGVSNYDFEWLLAEPSSLIWADSILVSAPVWRTIQEAKWPHPEPVAEAIRLLFTTANAEGIVEVVDHSEVISPSIRDGIDAQVERERKLLAQVFHDHVSIGHDLPGELAIDGYSYCQPRLWSINAALLLARMWDANCLFDAQSLNYCRYKFGLASFPHEADRGKIQSLRIVFDAYVPSEQIFPVYIREQLQERKCPRCRHEQRCHDSYLSELEANIKRWLALREYDEIQQIRSVVNTILRRRVEGDGLIDPTEIIREFEQERKKLRKRMRSTFPKVKRWANVALMLSTPVALAGIASGWPLLQFPAATLAGLSAVTKIAIENLSSRYSWVTFTNKED
jgi:hypothetical protein